MSTLSGPIRFHDRFQSRPGSWVLYQGRNTQKIKLLYRHLYIICCCVQLAICLFVFPSSNVLLMICFSNLMAGILPFGAVFIELFFILSVSAESIFFLAQAFFLFTIKFINLITILSDIFTLFQPSTSTKGTSGKPTPNSSWNFPEYWKMIFKFHHHHHHLTLEVGTHATTVLQTSRFAIAFPRSDLSIHESLAIMSGKVNLLEWTGPLGFHSERDWAISPIAIWWWLAHWSRHLAGFWKSGGRFP